MFLLIMIKTKQYENIPAVHCCAGWSNEKSENYEKFSKTTVKSRNKFTKRELVEKTGILCKSKGNLKSQKGYFFK